MIHYKKSQEVMQDIDLIQQKVQEGSIPISHSLLLILDLFAEGNQENKIKEIDTIKKTHGKAYKEYIELLSKIKTDEVTDILSENKEKYDDESEENTIDDNANASVLENEKIYKQ